jgi:hypothetical protein
MTDEEEIQCTRFIQIKPLEKSKETRKDWNYETHDILIYAEEGNLAGKNINTIKKKQNMFLLANKQAGLEINAQETKYIFSSHQRNLGK